MIEYESLSVPHRQKIAGSIRFFVFSFIVSCVIAVSILTFFKIGAIQEFDFTNLSQKLTDSDWLFRNLIPILCFLGPICFFCFYLYKISCLILDFLINKQAYIEGVLQNKIVKIRSSNADENHRGRRDKYFINLKDANDAVWKKKIQNQFYDNLLEGDSIKYIYAPYSKVNLGVELLHRGRISNPINPTTQSIQQEPLTEADIKNAKRGNWVYYFVIGFLLFMFITFNLVFYAVSKSEEPLNPYIYAAFIVLNLIVIYGFYDCMNRWNPFNKDIKSGYKIVRIGRVISKITSASQGRDSCIISLQTNAENPIKFTIGAAIFDKILPNDVIKIRHLERTKIVLSEIELL